MGCAILFPVTIAVVTNAFPEERRKRAIGNLYGLAAIATAAGPFVGGGVTESVGWRWVFLLNVPIAAAAFALTAYSVRESRDESAPRQIDLLGLSAIVLGIAAVTFAVDKGETWGWGSLADAGPDRCRARGARRLRRDRAPRRQPARRPDAVSQPPLRRRDAARNAREHGVLRQHLRLDALPPAGRGLLAARRRADLPRRLGGDGDRGAAVGPPRRALRRPAADGGLDGLRRRSGSSSSRRAPRSASTSRRSSPSASATASAGR